MSRLREEVEAPDALDLVPALAFRVALDQDTHVARLRVHVAADVDDAPGPVGEELAQEVVAAALAGRIDDK